VRALVTGAAGFVGSALLRAAPDGVEVAGTWRHTRPALAGVPVHRVDLADATAAHALLDATRPDVVVHTAYGTGDLGRDVVDATANVADAAAAGGAWLVHLSSDVVFSGEDPPYHEHTPPSPVSAYGRAKAAAEAEVEVAVPDAAIVRTSLVLTPETLDPRTTFVAEAVRASRTVDGYEDEVRMPVHRDDLVEGLWRLAVRGRGSGRGVWHLVGEVALSRYDLALLVCAAVGGEPELVRPVPSPQDPDDPRPRDLRLTAERARRELDWRPRDVRDGYRRTLDTPRDTNLDAR
jgi:dTDP-4-dehydrorhamnose reductase